MFGIKKNRKSGKLYIFLLLMVFAALVIRISLIYQSMGDMISQFLIDDSFYYFSIVTNVVEANGIVFNKGVPTNGFHPLYPLIITPIFDLLLQYGNDVPVRASLVVLSLFWTLAAIPIFGIGKKISGNMAGIISSFIWLFNPFLIEVSLAGVEAPIQIFFISLVSWYLLTIDGSDYTLLQSGLIGLLFSLIFLSRMDGAVILAGFSIAILIKKILHNSQVRIIDLILMNVIPGFVAGAWIWWSYSTTMLFTPVSGKATRLIPLYVYDYPMAVLDTGYSFATHIIRFFVNISLSPITTLALFSLSALIILILVIRVEFPRQLKFEHYIFVPAVILLISYYLFYQVRFREYYMGLIFLTMVIYIPPIIKFIYQYSFPKSNISWSQVAFGLLIISTAIGGPMIYLDQSEPRRGSYIVANNYVSEQIPEDERVGTFNTGIYQYYTPKHDVINLDGAVNQNSYNALKQNEMHCYLYENNVTHVIDAEVWINRIDGDLQFITHINPIPGVEYSHYRVPEPESDCS